MILFRCFILVLIFSNLASKIIIFGDSHSENNYVMDLYYKNFLYKGYEFNINYLGPITMHRIGRDGLDFLNIKNFNFNKDDCVIFCFGEIDVRCHIIKQSEKQNISFDEVIEDLVKRYIKTIIDNRVINGGKKFFVTSITPPADLENNQMATYYGSLLDRIEITKKLNFLLRQYCINNEIIYLDFYNFMSTNNGELNKEISDGMVHIDKSKNYMIKDITILYIKFVESIEGLYLNHLKNLLRYHK